MNVPFCAWLASLREAGVWIMFHEVALPWQRLNRLKANAGAVVTRLMANLLIARADRVFISIPSWAPMLRAMSPYWRGEAAWLPIPQMSRYPSRTHSAKKRARLGHVPLEAKLIGHFGTFGSPIVPLLRLAVRQVMQADPKRLALFVGRGSEVFVRGFEDDPGLRHRMTATGELPLPDIAAHLLACDVLIQPYPDGVSSRRTTIMAGLALGLPVVTNEGPLSERLWRASGAVRVTSSPCHFVEAVDEVLADPAQASQLGERGRDLYDRCFSLDRTVKTLLGDGGLESSTLLKAACGMPRSPNLN